MSDRRPRHAALTGWAPRRLKAAPGFAPGKGRGLFAMEPIGSGEVIDFAFTVPLTAEQCLTLDALLPLGDHYFAHPEDPARGLMVMGLASLCNHAPVPNSEVRWRKDAALGWIAVLVALAEIGAGEEITRRYACEPWFEPI